jgi:6-methylsalicylate decarboxylase
MANWTPEKSLADMDKAGTATAMLSPMPPHVGFLSAVESAQVTRASNEWTRKLASDHPGRFGIFAMLPMPNIDESLKEIAYAFDTLKVDGVGLMTNYGDKWLGYTELAPVFEELNRRKAVVYTHPMSPACCVNVVKGVGDGSIEWGADTTRTITNLIFNGASARYNDITFIFSHGGGVLTAVAERLRIQMVTTPPYKDKFTREMVDHELKRFYYDTAQVANEVTIQALAKLVPVSQIVFGTDFPYRTGAEHASGLTERFNAEDLAAIDRGNALRILPAWR